MTRLLVAPMRLLVSPTPLIALLPHCLLSSLVAPPAPILVLPSPLHPIAFLPCLHGGKVDLSGHLYGEVFLGYKILHGRVSLDEELHVVASLATGKRKRIYTLWWVML